MKTVPILSVVLAVAGLARGEPPTSASVERGRVQFVACAACHLPGQKDNPGPDLHGVLGRRAGSLPGFRYSRALRTANVVWSPATLDNFLTDPQAMLPGNGMPFPGVTDAGVRADLIAYLASLK